MNLSASKAPFSPTRWSLVLRAQGKTPEARAALSELCEAYHLPIYRFLRREGRDESTALDLTQAFFASILEKGTLNADQNRGKFRSYLLGAVKHFLVDKRKREQREKRGSGQILQSLDSDANLLSSDPGTATESSPDAWFDRQWALNVMERALSAIEETWTEKGKKEQFDILKTTLVGDGRAVSQNELAERLSWSNTATKVTVHRLRKQFRQRVRNEVANTIPDFANVEEELEYLIQALQHRPN